jgi:photosystem II stability/assembly factor-like uncharacterized protein
MTPGLRLLLMALSVTLVACTEGPDTRAGTRPEPSASVAVPASSPSAPSTALIPSPPEAPFAIVNVARTGRSTGWVLTSRGLAWTDDAGGTWRTVAFPGFDPSARRENGLFVRGSTAWLPIIQKDTGDVAIARASEGGRTTSRSTLPARYPGVVAVTLSFVGPADGWAAVGTTSNGVRSDLFRTSDGGEHWELVAKDAPFDGPIHFTNPMEGWALGRQLHRTADGGRTWTLQHPPAPFIDGLPGRFVALSLFGQRGVLQVAVPTGMQAFPIFDVTFDAGRTWVAREGDAMTYFGTGDPLLLAASDADNWHVAVGSQVWATADAGRHWTRRDVVSGATSAMSFPTPDIGWSVVRTDAHPPPATSTEQWKLLSTSDGGRNWTEVALPRS